MSILRYILLTAGILLAGSGLQAQPENDGGARKEALAQARYLKSIFKTDEAIDLLSGFITPGSMDEEVLAELADCHFQSADYESASGTYFLLSSRFPDKVIYKIKLMQAFYRLKDYPGSIMAGKAALQLDTIPAVMSFIGDAFRQMDRPDSALEYYSKSLAVKPLNETVLSKAANILLKAEDYDGVLAMTEAFSQEDPDNDVIAPVRGIAYYRKGDYANATNVFQRQEDIGNDSYPVHLYLGHCYWQTKVMYRAEKEFLAAWQIDSSDVNLAFYIGAVKAEAFRPFETGVKPWLDKVWDRLQPDPEFLSRLHQQYGQGYFKDVGDHERAIEHFKEAYRLNPKSFSILSTIGYCYESKKDYRNALEWYQKYLEVGKPGTKGYKFVETAIRYVKAQLFMDEPNVKK